VPRVCDRTLLWPDQRVRLVHLGTEERRATRASERPRDRSIWLGTQGTARVSKPSGCGSASGHMRSDVSGRGGSSLDSDRMPGAARLVKR
jgi:hypothetical protein